MNNYRDLVLLNHRELQNKKIRIIFNKKTEISKCLNLTNTSVYCCNLCMTSFVNFYFSECDYFGKLINCNKYDILIHEIVTNLF